MAMRWNLWPISAALLVALLVPASAADDAVLTDQEPAPALVSVQEILAGLTDLSGIRADLRDVRDDLRAYPDAQGFFQTADDVGLIEWRDDVPYLRVSLPEEAQAEEAQEEAQAEEAQAEEAQAEEAQAEEEQTPAEEEQAPAEEEQAPAEDEQVPVEEEQVPVEEEQAPAEEEQVPAEEEQVPAEEEIHADLDYIHTDLSLILCSIWVLIGLVASDRIRGIFGKRGGRM